MRYREKKGKRNPRMQKEERITELELFEEECSVERVGGGVEEELEAVEDLDGASPLDADDAAEDARGR